MDIVTQSLLGAAMAQSAACPRESRTAAGIGLLAGLAADADVLISSSADPLLALEYHRHFTHALVFIPIGGLLVALMLWPLLRRRLPFTRLYLFSLLGYSLSGFIDACTSYGTWLYWPFSETRVAWSIISIVDPVFTLLLVVAVGVAFRRRLARAAQVGLLLAVAYLLFGWMQHERALAAVVGLAIDRGHQVERLQVKPTLGNLLLWRSIYLYDKVLYVDGIRVGIMSGVRVYPGQSTTQFCTACDAVKLPPDSVQYRDIERFEGFSDGYLAWHPQRDDVIGDLRYAFEPTSLRPVWGITIDPLQPARHVRFDFYREITPRDRQRYLDMLLGRAVD